LSETAKIAPWFKPGAAMPVGGHAAMGMVAALLNELGTLLEVYLATGQTGSIDTLNIPISPADLKTLENELGTGEVSITIDAGGPSLISETAYAGIWWVHHKDETGRVVARLIEVTDVPAIVCADRNEIEHSVKRLRHFTSSAVAA
jgi:hydrogenase-1 operon protein HyaF